MNLTVHLADRGLKTAVRLLVLETVRSSSGRERVGLLLEAGVAEGSSRGVEGREVEVESLSASDRKSKGQGQKSACERENKREERKGSYPAVMSLPDPKEEDESVTSHSTTSREKKKERTDLFIVIPSP